MKLEISDYERGYLRVLPTKEKYDIRDSGNAKYYPEYTKVINRILKKGNSLEGEKIKYERN